MGLRIFLVVSCDLCAVAVYVIVCSSLCHFVHVLMHRAKLNKPEPRLCIDHTYLYGFLQHLCAQANVCTCIHTVIISMRVYVLAFCMCVLLCDTRIFFPRLCGRVSSFILSPPHVGSPQHSADQ